MTQISHLITKTAILHHFHRNTLEIRILIQVFAYRNTGINIKIRISTLDCHRLPCRIAGLSNSAPLASDRNNLMV